MSIVLTGKNIISKGISTIRESKACRDVFSTAKKLNKMAIQESRGEKLTYTYSKATPKDLTRLTSASVKDSYKRVTWTNPKDNKVYHILEEGRNNGKIQVRILDKDGAFIKNAELEPLNIVVFDTFYSPRGITHGEMMETFIKRHNPFANVERLEHKKGLLELIKYRGELPMHLETKRFKELERQMEKGKKVDYISISEVNLVDASDVAGKNSEIQKNYVGLSPYLQEIKPIFEKILSKGTRIFEAAGNDMNSAKNLVSDRLSIEGIEGVGSLKRGKIAKDSCSRNAIFTQHYEERNYCGRLSKDENGDIVGINVTGLPGTDLEITRKTKNLIGRKFGGTSYATPVRVAKEALNDMLSKVID